MSKIKDERDLLSKPGDVIVETLEHIKMSQAELAIRMGKTPSKVNDLISGKEPITVATALQLEKVLCIDAQFWLNRETLYREKLSRIEQEEVLEQCIEWLKTQPIKDLKDNGYIKSSKTDGAMAEEFLKFYAVATPVQWEKVYVNELVEVSFRKSPAFGLTLSAITAWLRMGEIESQKLSVKKKYDKDIFKNKLVKIRELSKQQPEDFAGMLQTHCLEAGVLLVYTACISKAPVSGASRWIAGTPLIQMTDRYKYNDQFWFTFFHEAGHVMLHGRKDVFIEELKDHDLDPKKEKDADDFANTWLLTEGIENEFTDPVTEKSIRQVAAKRGVHPGIVVGRLQHIRRIPYSFGINLKVRISLEYVLKNQRAM